MWRKKRKKEHMIKTAKLEYCLINLKVSERVFRNRKNVILPKPSKSFLKRPNSYT